MVLSTTPISMYHSRYILGLLEGSDLHVPDMLVPDPEKLCNLASFLSLRQEGPDRRGLAALFPDVVRSDELLGGLRDLGVILGHGSNTFR